MSGRGRRAPWLWWAVSLMVLFLGMTALVGLRPRGDQVPLSPGNARPEGARAVSRVLAAHGVTTRRVTTRAAVRAAAPDADTTVLVAGPLPEAAARDIAPDLRRAGRVVVVRPDHATARALDLPAQVVGADGGPTDRACGADLLPDPAPRWDTDGAVRYRPTGAATGCYRADGASALVAGPWGDAEAVVLGDGAFLTNDAVTDADQAQLALWLLGSRPELVWYLPDPADVPADADAGAPAALPDWAAKGMWLAFGAVGVLMVAQGRRFGPLSREPLPVVALAAETTVARARLQRRVGSVEHSAPVVRAAAARRLAGHVGLPAGAPLEEVAAALERVRPGARDLLLGPLPATDAELADWIAAVRALERTDPPIRTPNPEREGDA